MNLTDLHIAYYVQHIAIIVCVCVYVIAYTSNTIFISFWPTTQFSC